MRTVNAPFGSPDRLTGARSSFPRIVEKRLPCTRIDTRRPATKIAALRSRCPFGARSRMRNLRRLAQVAVVDGVVAEEPERPRPAVWPEQSPPPMSAGPESWRRMIGSEIARACPLTGSGFVVSPEAIIAHPRESMALVKKSPRRRSWPVATQVVPPWQTPLLWMGPPAASTVETDGAAVSAPVIVAALIEMSDDSQSRSTSLLDWYQTIETF